MPVQLTRIPITVAPQPAGGYVATSPKLAELWAFGGHLDELRWNIETAVQNLVSSSLETGVNPLESLESFVPVEMEPFPVELLTEYNAEPPASDGYWRISPTPARSSITTCRIPLMIAPDEGGGYFVKDKSYSTPGGMAHLNTGGKDLEETLWMARDAFRCLFESTQDPKWDIPFPTHELLVHGEGPIETEFDYECESEWLVPDNALASEMRN